MPKGGKISLIFGESGTYKTTNVGFFARWIYKTTGKKTRLLSGDLGGWDSIQPEIDASIIVPYGLAGLSNPIESMKRLCEGYWPVYNKLKGKMVFVKPTEETWKEFGGYAIEGITTIADLAMARLQEAGITLNNDPVYTYSEGTVKLHGRSRTYYNTIQGFLHQLIMLTNQLPVEKVLWTAHEAKGTEDKEHGGGTIIGPAVIGQAATPKVPGWVGDCLHFDFYEKGQEEVPGTKRDSKVKRKVLGVRAWFVSHPDSTTGIVQKAKTRVPSEAIPALMEKYPNGYFELTLEKGLDEYLDVIQELTAARTSSLATWKAQIDSQRKETKEN